MQAIIHRPLLLVGSSAVIIFLTAVCYHFLETDLLPAMDEGGFILDYYTPPGSSLTESERILRHMDKILKGTEEVENTSRRTGLQLGLAAVTEANRGDFTVRLKTKSPLPAPVSLRRKLPWTLPPFSKANPRPLRSCSTIASIPSAFASPKPAAAPSIR